MARGQMRHHADHSRRKESQQGRPDPGGFRQLRDRCSHPCRCGNRGRGRRGRSDPEEDSLRKARYAWERNSGWAMADHTGLFISVLGGMPGVKAARWAGETAMTDEITRHTLRALHGAEDRSAVFRTVVAVVSPEGGHRFFEGEACGRILEAPRVPPQPKIP